MAIVAALSGEAREEVAESGVYTGSWEGLSGYEAPEWFRDAKFGIWAHWGPQCQPEEGDWYGRIMYEEGSDFYKKHIEKYGHPTEFGFMDVMNEWRAPNWDPDALVKRFKDAGARYFFAMGNHHDNLDLWDSRHHEWNSVNVGPHKDVLAGWERAARAQGLPFGVSIHSSHAWTWYETAQRADTKGPHAGISYDARLRRAADGKGKWWEGLDPEKLYVQNHACSAPGKDVWDWPEGVAVPTQEYYDNFFDRTVDMINRFNPDLIYFDDSWVPFWPINNTGLEVIAHYYNHNAAQHDGKLQAVVFGKKLEPMHKESIVWDVEKGVLDQMQEKPWQTCTCLGTWHYNRNTYNDNWYKSAPTVVRMLADIVSKNGNLLLSVPVRGDGTIDDKEEAILDGISAWLATNGEGIYGTRPWKVFGEGPVAESAVPLDGAGFNEGKVGDYTSADVRYTCKPDAIYAHVMAWPAEGNTVTLRALGTDAATCPGRVASVKLLGGGKLSFRQSADGLTVTLPKKRPNEISPTLKITVAK